MHQLKWSGFHINIEWEPDAFGGIIAHLEIRSENSYPLPITNTGYLSHFTHKAEVMQHGWPVAYVRKWLEQEAGQNQQQTSLF